MPTRVLDEVELCVQFPYPTVVSAIMKASDLHGNTMIQ
jgi:hypothetical protein